MIRAVRFTLVAIVLSGSLAVASPTKDMEQASAEVDRLFQTVANEEFPGAAVSVVLRGDVIHQKAYGLANLELGVSNSTSTKFRLGSMTKQFTATAILQLQERGLLDVEDTLLTYFPEHPHGTKIKLRHLLTHTSGLPDFISFERTKTTPLLFQPGARVNYSNPGYYILGRIIEQVSGESYETYLGKYLFGPLGMNESGFDHPEAILVNRAAGYLYDPESRQVLNAPNPDMAGVFSAGALYSTVEDLVKWDQALYSDELLSRESRSIMFAPTRLSDRRESVCGMGWMVFQRKGAREIGHGGDIEGFNSYIARFPEREFSVIVLSNIGMWPPNPVMQSAGDLATRISQIYLGDSVLSERTPVKLEPGIYDVLTGTYEIDAPQTILQNTGKSFVVTREGDRLFGESKGGKLELFPESERTYFAREFPVTLTFIENSKGKVDQILFNLLGVREFTGRKQQ